MLKEKNKQQFIINDILSEEKVKKIDLLEKFKRSVIANCSKAHDFLLDVGASSGKFLFNNKKMFHNHAGIEITPECIRFSRDVLRLNIMTDVAAITSPISVATFWHSLEHMPADDIKKILCHVRSLSFDNTRIVISVPNNFSLQYRLFGEGYAFYDLQNHIHQFSADSLNRLMENSGFDKVQIFRSSVYNIFGYLQGFMNKCNSTHNYFYYRKKRMQVFDKSKKRLLFLDIYNYALAVLFLMPAILLSLYDSLFPGNGGVITACYRKKKN
ncbi:MAG: class I SAM-dependent methyltransferase [Nitrospirae bacterium]|nr:class I SAM-dependent methyltransferase [Nitrospirota bacterium]